jgi:hypothetical protein
MLGVNEIKSDEEIPSSTIIALCEGLLCKMEEPDIRRLRNADPDRYFRSLQTQFKRLNDRYPGIFNLLTQYGRKTPQGADIMARIKEMIGYRDQIVAGEINRDKADKEIDYKYAYEFVRPAIGNERFDTIVKPPNEREDTAATPQASKGSGLDGVPVQQPNQHK